MKFQVSKIDWIAIQRLFKNQGWVEFKKYLKRLDNSLKNAIININDSGDEFLKKYFELRGQLQILEILKNFEFIVQDNIDREIQEEKIKKEEDYE